MIISTWSSELAELREMGVSRFRLSPHDCDMVEVAATFRAALDGRIAAPEAAARLDALKLEAPVLQRLLLRQSGPHLDRRRGYRFPRPAERRAISVAACPSPSRLAFGGKIPITQLPHVSAGS